MAACIRVSEGTRTPDSQIHNLEWPRLKGQSDNDLHPAAPVACCSACWAGPEDADLAQIVGAWPNLPANIRAGILALIQTGR